MKKTDVNTLSLSGWMPDMLGDGFEMKYVMHPDDYSGPVRSTVIRKIAKSCNGLAIVYVHGFSDYFLQKEMADMFVGHGYSFYAVDLRKYGRSLLPGQRMFQVKDIHEYFADIEACIEVALSDGMASVVLLGHSTGGLTASLYMSGSPSDKVKGLMLNSPFLDWNLPGWMKRFAIPVVCTLGRLVPRLPVKQTPDDGYARSLLADYDGEWTYRRDWKPDVLPDPDAGWVRAIHRAQKQLRHRIIKVPVLLMHSAESVRHGDPKEKYNCADAILDVTSISRYGRMLGPDVTEVGFAGGLHDLVLSRPAVRRQVYQTMLDWLREWII